MIGALSEYVISGFTTNISFLKSVIDHQSFRKGDININFLEKYFLKGFNESDNEQGLKEKELAAAILSSLLKFKSTAANVKIDSKDSTNSWQEQMYE